MSSPHPDAGYFAGLVQSEGFLTPADASACRGAFKNLTINHNLYADQPTKVAELGAQYRDQFAGLGIAGCADVGTAPLVDGVTANGPGKGIDSSTARNV
ncbi:MAG: hypothetical protein K2Q12_00155 [Rickettsiales bacterium]|nr:hypothetical protein [Rickettsiales bacterium]